MSGKIRIGLIGAGGRLGRSILAFAKQENEVEITHCFHKGAPPEPTADLDLFLDVSLPCALAFNVQTALKAKKPLVVGTTGHESLQLLVEASTTLPIFYSPNFSQGMAWMRRIAEELARGLSPAVHIDLVEAHHSGKRDKPSGSAKALAEIIESNHLAKVHIHSIRSGSLPGEHTLYFNTPEERIVISHQAHSSAVFAAGALTAAKFLVNCPPGLYGMDDLLYLRNPNKIH